MRIRSWPDRLPFDPPYLPQDLDQLDRLHRQAGLWEEWLSSDERRRLQAAKPETMACR